MISYCVVGDSVNADIRIHVRATHRPCLRKSCGPGGGREPTDNLRKKEKSTSTEKMLLQNLRSVVGIRKMARLTLPGRGQRKEVFTSERCHLNVTWKLSRSFLGGKAKWALGEELTSVPGAAASERSWRIQEMVNIPGLADTKGDREGWEQRGMGHWPFIRMASSEVRILSRDRWGSGRFLAPGKERVHLCICWRLPAWWEVSYRGIVAAYDIIEIF